ncbi:MAG: host attachment protein [Pseudomonadota bacterium]
MGTTWILVSNASTARLYANHGPKKGLKLLKELAHPESREKVSALVSDRPGHNQGAGNGHGSFISATDPKQHEADRFAHELARELEQGRAANRYDRLILVASSPFIGKLNHRLDNRVRGMVSNSIEKDYTKIPERELAGRLENVVYL